MSSAEADLPFLAMTLSEERRRGSALPLDALLVLAGLREQKRLDVTALASLMQSDVSRARAVAERLVEAGLAQPQGNTRRTYTLSPAVYGKLGLKAESVRQAGFSAIQQVEMVRNFVRQHGEIRRADVVALCHLTDDQATRLLKRLVDQEILRKEGTVRWTVYQAGPRF